MVLLSWQSHCDSSHISFYEGRICLFEGNDWFWSSVASISSTFSLSGIYCNVYFAVITYLFLVCGMLAGKFCPVSWLKQTNTATQPHLPVCQEAL